MATQRWIEQRQEEERRRKEQEQARQQAQAQQAAQEQEPVDWAAKGLRPASEQRTRVAPLVVRLDAQDDGSAAQVASRIPDKTAQGEFLTDYRKASGTLTPKGILAEEANARIPDLMEVTKQRQQTGQDILTAQTRSDLMGTLSGITLMGFDGVTINPRAASAPTVERCIRSIADKDEREAAAAAYVQLTRTKGSNFYGQPVDEGKLTTFLESANLTATDYKNNVAAMSVSFWGDGAHDEEDAQNYLEQRAFIEGNEAYSPYAKAQYLAALDKIYTGITGKAETPQSPSATDLQRSDGSLRPLGEAALTPLSGEPEERPDAAGEEPKKPGFWEGLSYKKPEEPEAPQAPEATETPEVFGPARPPVLPKAPEPTVQQEAAEAPDIQGPVQQASEESARPSLNELLAAGAPMPPAREEPKVTAETPGEAMGYLMRGQYDQVAGPGVDALNRTLENSRLAQQIIGTLSEEDAKRIELGNDPAETIAFEAIANNGQTVREIHAMIMSDNYPEDLRWDALAQMAVWAARAEEMEREGTLGGYDPELPPEDQLPLMERLLTTDETSMAELAAIRQARADIDADMAGMRAETQQRSEQSLKEAKQAALRGEMSEEQRALLAESAKDVGYAELQESACGSQLRARLGEVDEYIFSGGWAQSGVKLALDARGVTDTGDYEIALNDQMAVILNEDATIAYALGMTLEDYYQKTGGMDMNRLCELAAARIAQEGASITAEEEALLSETPGAPEGEGVGMGYALGAGAKD